MRKFRIPIIALLCLFPFQISSQPASIGIGGLDCGRLNADIANNSALRTQFSSWLSGFITGRNIAWSHINGDLLDVSKNGYLIEDYVTEVIRTCRLNDDEIAIAIVAELVFGALVERNGFEYRGFQ